MKNIRKIGVVSILLILTIIGGIKPQEVFALEKYTITYQLNGGVNDKKNPTTYDKKTATITLKEPTKKGYIFDGWYTNSNYKKQVTQIKKGSNQNKTLYAKWTPIKYTIKFDGNDATNGKMSNTANLKYGTSYELPKNTFKRTGYEFTSWNTKKDGSGKNYKNKEKIKNLTTANKKKITLYAQWKKTKYTISYILDGGMNDKKNPATYDVKTATIPLKEPTKKGYIFAGWYTNSNYKTKVTEIKKGSTGNKKLYAKWTAIKYAVTFHGNSATSGKMADITNMKYSTSYELPKNTFKRTGYEFVGWNTKKDGSGTSYQNKEKVKKLTATNKKTVTLYAQWKKIKYTISYFLEDGMNDKRNPNTYDIKTATITLKAPTREGYIFEGWYDSSNYKTKVTEIKKGSTGNKKLYAKWKENFTFYQVTFDSDGGTSVASQSIKQKTKVFVPQNPTKQDYKFVEWQLDGKKYDFNLPVTKNITLKAVWKEAIKEYSFSITDIEIHNSNSNYIVELFKEPSYKVTIMATKSQIANLKMEDIQGYVDVKDAINGTQDINIQLDGIVPDIPYQVQPEKVKVKITDKSKTLNLNDRIHYVIEYIPIWNAVGYYVFSSNIDTVLSLYLEPRAQMNTTTYWKPYEQDEPFDGKSYEDFIEREKQLIYEEEKENEAISKLEKLKQNIPVGVAHYEYRMNNHKFNYSYRRMHLYGEQYQSVYPNYDENIDVFANYIDNDIFGNASLIMGDCGDVWAPDELTESLCEEYNLSCSRW